MAAPAGTGELHPTDLDVVKFPKDAGATGPMGSDVGLRDAMASGQYNDATGELYPGFAITADDIVVDVGRGDGAKAGFCARMGATVISVDSDLKQVEAASRHLVGDGNPRPLEAGIATRVIAAEVIGQVDDPRHLLSELVRVGRPGAAYLLTVPDPVAEELQRGLAPGMNFERPNHARAIGRDEFARMVAEAGLVIEHRGAHGFYWTIWWMFFWICKIDLGDAARHPLLESWSKTWNVLLDTPGGDRVRQALDALMPMSQYIVARKPGGVGLRGALNAIRRALRSANQPAAGAPPSTAQPAGEEDLIDARSVGLHDAVEGGWFKMDRKELFEGFAITPEDIVLDVGCGDGNYSSMCGRWGAHVIFTDIDPANVATTERRLAGTAARGMTPIVGDANPLPLADETASKIISTEVMEHVDDPVRFLSELARVGKKGALYLLAVPDPVQEGLQRQLAPASFFVKPKPEEGLIRGLSSGHLRTIGRDEFEQLVTSAGLVVERRYYVGFFWALWFSFFWICDVDFSAPRHPLLTHWARTWKTVLESPDGRRVKTPLDAFMPKSQIIIARKP